MGRGLPLLFPEELNGQSFGENGPAFEAAIGFERFSKLRHFSFGIFGGVTVFTKPETAVSVNITPTLKYTF